MNNRCYTYFRIVGKFNTDDISHILNLTPEKKWDIGDVRPNGSKYGFANWAIGYKGQMKNLLLVDPVKMVSMTILRNENLKKYLGAT